MTPATCDFDLVVVGGGVNGAGIARDAAGRGLRVLLCDKDDLAAHTSSASTKLIHGGLRYLEHYEFSLVSKALVEREVLLRAAPHIIRPMRFVLPHSARLRPAWMVRAGLFLYDHLDFGKRKLLPGSQHMRLAEHAAGRALRPEYTVGFEYSDGWVHDARLVVLSALDAAERGADVRPRVACVGGQRDAQCWTVSLRAAGRREVETVRTRVLVNATGPWVGGFLAGPLHRHPTRRVRQVKGSHIVVPAMFEHAFAYTLQNADGRVVFAIPYEGRYTLVGTTEVDWEGDPGGAEASDDEIEYLCEAVGRYFRHPLGRGDVVRSFSGVRPLIEDEHEDASAVTRDYYLDLDTGGAPLLSVFGGKITTFRKLAEEAVDLLGGHLHPASGPWTETAHLPGGDIEDADFERFAADALKRWPALDGRLVGRLAQAYGTRLERVLGPARGPDDLGRDLGSGIHERELEYLRAHEWAASADDVLWRRSSLGLHVCADTRARVERWFGEASPAPSGPPGATAALA